MHSTCTVLVMLHKRMRRVGRDLGHASHTELSIAKVNNPNVRSLSRGAIGELQAGLTFVLSREREVR